MKRTSSQSTTNTIEQDIEIESNNFTQPSSLDNLKHKRFINYSKFPLLKESIDLRSELIKRIQLPETNKIKPNLSAIEINVLKKFKDNQPFKILQCDKNVGLIIISNNEHSMIALEHLNSNDTYRKCTHEQLPLIVTKINSTLEKLHINGHLSDNLFKYLQINSANVKAGKFRVLAKIHKAKFGIRPIINCRSHPTESLCKLVDILLQPIIKSIKTILKDSQQLLQDLNNINFNRSQFLYSCDFESLYTNMKPGHTIETLARYINNETEIFSTGHIDVFGFTNLLNLIFTCNIFSFENEFYVQLIGLPMGCKCGPTVANLYLHALEKSYLSLHPQVIYYRFIDDIFMSSDTLIDLNELFEKFLYLKLNVVQSETVNFLDLNIYYNSLENKIQFSLYTKPTNTFAYLRTDSNHPKMIFKNIPKSLFIRIRRICSSYFDYVAAASRLKIQLVKRGYDYKFVNAVAINIGNMPRDMLLPYKRKENSMSNNNNMIALFKFNSLSDNFKSSFQASFDVLKSTYSTMCDKSLFFVNKINLNIGSLLVHNARHFDLQKKFFIKCKNRTCQACKHAISHHYIKSSNFILPLLSMSNCSSTHVVYIIICLKCNVFYVGETKRTIKLRIGEHLRGILNYKKKLDKSIINLANISETALHFNSHGHHSGDLAFVVFRDELFEDEHRFSVETDIINILIARNISILNTKLSSQYKVKKLTFLS